MRIYDYIERYQVADSYDDSHWMCITYNCKCNCMEQLGYAVQEALSNVDAMWGMSHVVNVEMFNMQMYKDCIRFNVKVNVE